MSIIRGKTKYPIKITVRCVLIFIIIASVALGAMLVSDIKSISLENNVKIIVSDGWGINKTAKRLYEEKIIKYPTAFEILAKVMGVDDKVQPGWLEIEPGMSYGDILTEVSKVNRDAIQVTIPEGSEIRQIADILEDANLIDRKKFYDALNKDDYHYEFLTHIPDRDNELEGYLFPATYSFLPGIDESEIIDEMLKAFQTNFVEEYYDRAENLGMSIDEIVTLASIIERESNSSIDRKKVAGVFYNRLQQNMRLQSCATVQYILKERKTNLSTADTKIKSPYNTYINDGLPIGPIASPGIECIEAALYPERTDALYFVLGNDGKHIFSTTYEEHIKNKEEAGQ